MSIEARSLADKMNKLDLSAEKSKDDVIYENGKREYHNIKRNIAWILPSGLRIVPDYLNDNGKVVYNRFFKKLIEEEIESWRKKK